MRIGNWSFDSCNECPAFEWAGESISKGDHGMRCAFGAFHSEYPDYGEKYPIPENCPIKSSDTTEQYENQNRECKICDWKGIRKDLIIKNDIKYCPDCGLDFLED